MKSNTKIEICGLDELNETELFEIQGGCFFGCDPSNCIIAFASSVFLGLIQDNIEHSIGASAGYPPK